MHIVDPFDTNRAINPEDGKVDIAIRMVSVDKIADLSAPTAAEVNEGFIIGYGRFNTSTGIEGDD